MAGISVLPMKYAQRWTWANVWLMFNALSLLIIPFVILSLTAPQAWATYSSVPVQDLAIPIALGLGWGIGCVLCGISYTMLGVGLGMSIVLGLAAIAGSILPLLILFPTRLQATQTRVLYWGMAVLLLGLILTSRAGSLRQKARPREDISQTPLLSAFGKGDLRRGLVVAACAGILSGFFNVALASGSAIHARAIQLGASSASAVNILWLPITSAAFLAILIYCTYLLTRSKSWSRYVLRGSLSHWLLVFAMALLYTASIALYGFGATFADAAGTVVGFPVYMSSMIITGNLAGVATREWTGAPNIAWFYALAGLLALVGAIILVSSAAMLTT